MLLWPRVSQVLAWHRVSSGRGLQVHEEEMLQPFPLFPSTRADKGS